MSTRGNICIKLREEDLDKDFHMKDKYGDDVEFTIHTSKHCPYMFIYNHHDSYIERPGLGFTLPRKVNTYEEVRDFILQGNRTSLDTPYTADPYGEDFEDNQPQFASTCDGEIPEEFFYLFDNDKWYVKSYTQSINGEDFKELDYKQRMITLNEKEIAAIEWIIDKYEKIWNVVNNIDESHHLVVMGRVYDIQKKIKEA